MSLPTPAFLALVAAPALAAVPVGAADAANALAACRAAAEQQQREAAEQSAASAEAALTARLAAHPRDGAALLLRARVALECRMPFAQMLEQGALAARAERDLRAAIAADPENGESRMLLATLLYHLPPFLGRTEEAVVALEELVVAGEKRGSAAPAEAYRMLSELLERSGEAARAEEIRARARRHYLDAPELTPSAPAKEPGPEPTPAGPAQPRAAGRVEALDRALATRLLREARRPLVAGIAAAVVTPGEPAVVAGAGFADLENDVPMTGDSVVAIGSVTKQFVAAALLDLAAKGRIALEDPVVRWLPELDALPAGLTLRHLLGHTGGLPESPEGPSPEQPDWRLATLAGAALEPPGERHAYSNFGYALAGEVLERASGSARYLEEALLAPLGLSATGWCDQRRLTRRRAHGYRPVGAGLENLPFPVAGGALRYAGGLCSTVGDLARWLGALHSGRVLPEALYRRMVTPVPVRAPAGNDYALGLRIARRVGEPVIRHSGAIDGFLTETSFWPQRRVGVVVALNTESGDPVAIAAELAAWVAVSLPAAGE
jgi:CubicO group peptidase (beta-lactamase class C family)